MLTNTAAIYSLDDYFSIGIAGQTAWIARRDVLYVRLATKEELTDAMKEAVISRFERDHPRHPRPVSPALDPRYVPAVIVSAFGRGTLITETPLRLLLQDTLPFVDVGHGRWVPADNIDELCPRDKLPGRARPVECNDWHPFAGQTWVLLNSRQALPSVKTKAELEDDVQLAYKRALAVRKLLPAPSSPLPDLLP